MYGFNDFSKILKSKYEENYDVIFLCIGSDKVIGDCVGPITGSLLKNRIDKKFIYGNLESNLTYTNVTKKIYEIKEKFKKPYIVAIDSALSCRKNIGKIFFDESGITMGNGLCKIEKKVGDIGVKAVVGLNYCDRNLNFKSLQNISLGEILYFSKKISDGIFKILNK